MSLNNNLSNLLNLPAAWNQNLKKARKVQKRKAVVEVKFVSIGSTRDIAENVELVTV